MNMKTKWAMSILGCLTLLWGSMESRAQTLLYFDLNGLTDNYGDPGTGDWSGTAANWNTSNIGGAGTLSVWTNNVWPATPDNIRFKNRGTTHNGTFANPTFRVNVVGTQHVGQFSFEPANFAANRLYVVLTNGVVTVNHSTPMDAQSVSNMTFHVNSDMQFMATSTNPAAIEYSFLFNVGSLSSATAGNQMFVDSKWYAGITNKTYIYFMATDRLTQSTKVTLTAASEISNGMGAGMAVIFGRAGSQLAQNGRIEIYSTNSYTGRTWLQGAQTVVYVNSLAGQNGAFGNSTDALRIGGVTDHLGMGMQATNTAILLTGASGVTIGRNLQVDSGNTNNTLFGVRLGGEHTSGTSTFSGNINLSSHATFARTNAVQLTAATGGRVLFSGNLTETSGAVPIEKIGGGTIELAGNNSYNGGTTVSEGTLLVTGSLTGTGAVTVATGAILGGNGYIRGNTTVNGTLAPGTSPGELTFNGHLTLGSGSTSQFEINGLLSGQYDQVLLSSLGTQNLTLAGTLDLTIGAFSANPGDIIWLFRNDTDGTTSGTFTGFNQGGFVDVFAGQDWHISYQANSAGNQISGGNDVALYAIPEPGTLGVLGLGLIATLLRRRLRKA